MSRAVVVSAYGGPENLSLRDVAVPDPGPGEVTLRQTAVGVNFIDVYFRTGRYLTPPPPCGIGGEACGVVEKVGAGVADLAVGDRVAYCAPPFGAYAERRTLGAASLVKVPEGVSDETAAAMMLKGLTAEYLLFRTHAVKEGETVVVHAAAGGVGLILCQWAKHLGATVVAVVSTDEKAALARENGADHAVVTSREEFVPAVRRATGGAGADVVYDSVGKDTFLSSLDCAKPRGLVVLFGQSSGDVPPFDPQLLSQKGSLFLTRPTLNQYVATRPELVAASERLFSAVKTGTVKIRIGGRYPLAEAARAH
ncbi:MAG TPA: quinone oxidoreductase, partial [Polyangiaceae bacterium]|nr:quinone oxidoreductase [Polyangiaceae bacterium]